MTKALTLLNAALPPTGLNNFQASGFTPTRGSQQIYFTVFNLTSAGQLTTVVQQGWASCKAYMDEWLFRLRRDMELTALVPDFYYLGITHADVITREEILQTIHMVEDDLGFRYKSSIVPIVTEAHGNIPHTTMVKLAKRWMRSSYAFSLLTWIIRSSMRHPPVKSIEKLFEIDSLKPFKEMYDKFKTEGVSYQIYKKPIAGHEHDEGAMTYSRYILRAKFFEKNIALSGLWYTPIAKTKPEFEKWHEENFRPMIKDGKK